MGIISADKLTQNVIGKVKAVIANQSEQYGGADNISIEVEVTDDFIFVATHHTTPRMADYSHRYGRYVYDCMGICLLFSDSNVIDKTFVETIEDVKRNAYNFWTGMAKDMAKYYSPKK